MNIISGLKRLTLFFVVSVAIVSCKIVYNPYHPSVRLQSSPKSINKTVRVEKFVDLSDTIKYEALHKKPLKGAKNSKKAFESYNFENEVTNAIISDFSAKGIFKNIGRNVDNPDFVLKGEIKKFTLSCNQNTLFKICAWSWFGTYTVNPIISIISIVSQPVPSPIYVLAIPSVAVLTTIPFLAGASTGHPVMEVEIIVSLYDKKNNLIGTYIGKDEAGYTDKLFKVNSKTYPDRANAIFSNVVGQIQEQIQKDINRLSE